MIRIDFTFDTSGLETLARELQPRIDRTVHNTAIRVRDSWKRRAAVETGRYRDSIHEEPGGVTKSEWIVQPDPALDYPEYVEFGTSRQAAQPAMVPAVEENRQQFADDLAKVFDL